MRMTTYAAALVAALALGTAAPGAHAYGGLGCGLFGVEDPNITGQPAEGLMYGGPFTDTGPIAIRCYLTVNGVEVASTPTVSGTGTVSTVGHATFAANATDEVKVCAAVTVPAGTQHHCVLVATSPAGPPTYYYAPPPVI